MNLSQNMTDLAAFRMNERYVSINNNKLYRNQSLPANNPVKSRPFDPNAIKQQMYTRHNNYRYLHNSPLLCWSAELAEFSQVWANKIAEKGYLQYSENPSLGENIVIVDLQECPTGEEIVDKWYEERKYYDYDKPGWSKSTFHFSQMIWRSSSEIGVGVQKFKNKNCAAIVVNYKPCGNDNLPGEYKKNVLMPKPVNLKDIKKRNSCQNSF
ncbi:Golgi-associated plant pathogenesis-related protein 1-like [Centruroides vittatus]|uniref:Golgi-associated plant pathogenesis-related protein 1-like n=1 Tax=Centruroides vittatus TaxID=120091 RepID=UPI00350FF1C9